jgi:DNA-binding NarL/FixJ family response regulator
VIFLMAFIILNKFEKEKRVIELHLEGKTIRDIAKEVHMSFRDISKIIKNI